MIKKIWVEIHTENEDGVKAQLDTGAYYDVPGDTILDLHKMCNEHLDKFKAPEEPAGGDEVAP